jgi:hypothetical protein
MMKSKKGLAPIFAVIIIIFILIGLYAFLLLPIPNFAQIRGTINYFIFIIFWVTVQVGLIFAYYEIGKFAVRGFVFIKTKILGWSMNFRRYVIMHK